MVMASWSLYGSAYSLSNHELITRNATALIKMCQLDEKNAVASLENTYVRFNLKQDDLNKKPLMWHFPLPIDDQQAAPNENYKGGLYKLLVEEASFNNWFNYLMVQAAAEGSFENRAPAVGAMMHFIQDVAVPAHAVPIFHPSKWLKRDQFDEWDKFEYVTGQQDIEKEYRLLKFSKNVCALLSTNNPPLKILSQVHKNTLQSLDAKIKPKDYCLFTREYLFFSDCIPANTSLSWRLFWPDQVNELGFAEYGCDKEDRFGDDVVSCSGTNYKIKPELFKQFAMERLKQAVVASANLILYYQHLPQGKRGACQQQQWVVSKSLLECI